MKKFTLKTLATVFAAAALLFASCKKGDTGPAGPAGANGTNGVVPTYSDGFIKGNVSGTRQDGTSFNEAFDFRNYYSGPSGRLDSNSTVSYNFMISRSNDVFGENSATITVNTTSKTASTGTLSLNDFSFTKSLGTNKKFVFTTSGTPTASITGLSYNTSSGLFTGSYSISVPGFQNSTGNAATISGTFEATITQMYSMIHGGGIKDIKD